MTSHASACFNRLSPRTERLLIWGLLVLAMASNSLAAGPVTKAEVAAHVEELWSPLLTRGLRVDYTVTMSRHEEAGATYFYGPFADKFTNVVQGRRFYGSMVQKASGVTNSVAFDGVTRYDTCLDMFRRQFPTGGIERGFFFECIGYPQRELNEPRSIVMWHRQMCASRLETSPADSYVDDIVSCLASAQYGLVVLPDSSRLSLVGPADSIVLDRDRGFAVVQRDIAWFDDGPLQLTLYGTDFREIASGVWLPQTIHIKRFPAPVPGSTMSGKPGQTIVITAAGMASGPFPDSQFVLSPAPGMQVSDLTAMKGPEGEWEEVNYTWADSTEESGRRLDQAVSDAKARLGVDSRGGMAGTLAVGTGVCILILVGLLYLHRQRQNLTLARTPPS
jgi:hypothetical protein